MRIHKMTIDAAQFDVVHTGMGALVEKLNKEAPRHGQFYVEKQYLRKNPDFDEEDLRWGPYIVVDRDDEWEWVNLRVWTRAE